LELAHVPYTNDRRDGGVGVCSGLGLKRGAPGYEIRDPRADDDDENEEEPKHHGVSFFIFITFHINEE
jgi:hypothetical protein